MRKCPTQVPGRWPSPWGPKSKKRKRNSWGFDQLANTWLRAIRKAFQKAKAEV